MDIRELPGKLIWEFGHNVRVMGDVTLADTHENVTLAARSRGSSNEDVMCFEVWWTLQSAIDGDAIPVFKIEAGVESAGTWSYGLGRRLREIITMQTGYCRPIDPTRPYASLVHRIYGRVLELVQSGAFEQSEFWEKDIHPDRDFHRPPHF